MRSAEENPYVEFAKICLKGASVIKNLQREMTVTSPARECVARDSLHNAGAGVGLQGFRYSYLARLIDDSELADLPRGYRRDLRKVHAEVYWKQVSLLQRDSRVIVRSYRTLMARRNEWNFPELVSVRSSIARLIWMLRMAGLMHALHISDSNRIMRGVMRQVSEAMSSIAAEIRTIPVSEVAEAPFPVVSV